MRGEQALCSSILTLVFLDLIWGLLGADFPLKLTDLLMLAFLLSFSASREKLEKLKKVLQYPQINHIFSTPRSKTGS
jgi:hypothetical protein